MLQLVTDIVLVMVAFVSMVESGEGDIEKEKGLRKEAVRRETFFFP